MCTHFRYYRGYWRLPLFEFEFRFGVGNQTPVPMFVDGEDDSPEGDSLEATR